MLSFRFSLCTEPTGLTVGGREGIHHITIFTCVQSPYRSIKLIHKDAVVEHLVYDAAEKTHCQEYVQSWGRKQSCERICISKNVYLRIVCRTAANTNCTTDRTGFKKKVTATKLCFENNRKMQSNGLNPPPVCLR
jgi:hypothetical protein